MDDRRRCRLLCDPSFRYLLWEFSSLIGSGQDQTMDALHQLKLMEVDEKTYGAAPMDAWLS
jgi:hypothetical protein